MIYQQKRFTAKECMNHPYFKGIREIVEAELAKKRDKQVIGDHVFNSSFYIKQLLLQQLQLKIKDIQVKASEVLENNDFHQSTYLCKQLEVNPKFTCKIQIMSRFVDLLKKEHTIDISKEAKVYLESIQSLQSLVDFIIIVYMFVFLLLCSIFVIIENRIKIIEKRKEE